jgi:hypothetical protein
MIGSVDVLSLVTPVWVVVVIVVASHVVLFCMHVFPYLHDVNMLAIIEAVVVFLTIGLDPTAK